jgi:hypothetical protein
MTNGRAIAPFSFVQVLTGTLPAPYEQESLLMQAFTVKDSMTAKREKVLQHPFPAGFHVELLRHLFDDLGIFRLQAFGADAMAEFDILE